MEKKSKKSLENDVLFSQTVHAGSRIYYVDVKKTRTEDMFLCITESKRVQQGEGKDVEFEKHKVFLYREDFSNFMNVLNKAVEFINERQGEAIPRNTAQELQEEEKTEGLGEEIKINIEF